MAAFRELRAKQAAVSKVGCWVPSRLHLALCVQYTKEAAMRLLGAAKQSVGRGSTCTCRCVQHM